MPELCSGPVRRATASSRNWGDKQRSTVVHVQPEGLTAVDTVRLRVLFTCRSLVGHFLPMIPLARALVAAGHEAAFASGAVVGAEADRLGVRHFSAGPDQMSAEERAAVFPEIKGLTPEQIRPFFFERVFADYELPLRAKDLETVVDDWKPDLLIHEVAELAGPLVAMTHDLAYATHSYGVVLGDDGVAAAARGARRYWQEAGLSPHPRAGLWEHLYLDICPPSLQQIGPPGAPLVQLVRPGERTPSTPNERPLVYVTLGTVYARGDVFRAIFAALADEPVDVIVTIGTHGDPTALGRRFRDAGTRRFVRLQRQIRSTSGLAPRAGSTSSTSPQADPRSALAPPISS